MITATHQLDSLRCDHACAGKMAAPPRRGRFEAPARGPSSATDDGEEFLRLLEPIRGALHRFARRSVWDKQRVEDVLAEAVLEGWRSFARFERGTNFRAWMMTILARKIYPTNRRYRRQQEREVLLETRDLDVVTQALEEGDRFEHPIEHLEQWLEGTSDQVKAALDDLSPMQRSAFLLRAAEGLSYEEIGQALGIPSGTVMSHLARARLKLRKRLYDHARDLGLAGLRG